MGQHIKINLSSRVEVILNQLVSKRTIKKHFELRINIVLMSAKTISYQTIKKKLQTSEPTISFWRQRWYNNQDKLQTFITGIDNQNVTDNNIKKEILTILDDAPRSGTPAEFTDEIQKKIMAVACESPQQYELPFSHWTHKELAKQVIKLGIVNSISGGHLGRLLKKTNYRHTSQNIGFIRK